MPDYLLPQGAGYGVVVGIGLFFSGFMIILTAIQARYTGFSPKNSEEFNSASRSIKPGLIASGIVSAWTWAATLLQSSAVAYKFGISGPWWYGAGATVQILLFAMLAAKLKLNAPYAHTWLEIVGARWGRVAHGVFMFFGLATNIIVSSMLVLGGSATVTDLTGMHTVAACFLIPLGVAIYVVVGGMRSTLLCDYTHTAVLFAIILTFIFTVYATSDKIGSPTRMHELLTAASAVAPVEGNAHGSYITMRSKNGLIFGVINIIGNFATVFQDQAYWQRAIASRPATTVKAYLLGGLAWFAIPFTFATTLGLAAVALRGDPEMRILTPADVSAGLPASAAAAALLGKSGATALLILLFLAVTSACSAELIAVSSILTFDVYKEYINPRATEEQILRVGHAGVALYAVICGVAGTIFYYIGISMGWLYTFMGVLLGSAVVPIALAITWRKANKWGCIGGAIAGGIIATVVSYIWPEDFDWEATRSINKPAPVAKHTEAEKVQEDSDSDKKGEEIVSTKAASIADSFDANEEANELDPVALSKAYRFASWSSIGLFVILILLVPLPLFFSQHVYTVPGFTGWVAVGITWTFCSAFAVVLYPLWESRSAMAQIAKGVFKDLFQRGSGRYVTPTTTPKAEA
ncbi:hypothetical protein EST38_g8834 [Candolleomyces aberdarensis]|uniref:Urea transporter n=1 Tax=Candolleomyces aberdarensis TaxID=2316362 RepID=A0A4Q2DDN1_9AGAR|nr:hypothetical protein EST38_g8834 [Candolleomyces aberdarensis]